jgi:signal transduction histidine kinase
MSAELACREPLPQAAQAQLNRVLGAVGDGVALVQRFREIAQSGKTVVSEPVDLDSAVAVSADFARQYARKMQQQDGRQVEILVAGCATPLRFKGDAAEIREVILNLLRNAVDAIPGKGAVQVSTFAEGNVAAMDILDNGTGMTAEVQEHLFTPMFTTKGEEGTGLGLASAHAAIRRHGGSISVQSAPGRGSRFRIELPRL